MAHLVFGKVLLAWTSMCPLFFILMTAAMATSESLQDIKHLVLIIQENRAFDHV
jgi:phospholipase C